ALPMLFPPCIKDAPASVDIAVSPSKGDAESNMVTGRRFSRIASTIKGSAKTHLRYRIGEEELTSGGPRVSSAEAGHPEISSARRAVKRVINCGKESCSAGLFMTAAQLDQQGLDDMITFTNGL